MPRFRRVTTTGKFVPEIDGLRFVAVGSVVLYHLYGFLPNGGAGLALHAVAIHGYRGVNLFYVISGFVLGLPFASHYFKQAKPVRLSAYFLRRLTRLEPPYILNLFLCFSLIVLTQRASPRAQLPHLGASILYLHNVIYGDQSTINPVVWTLEVEVQFYCLMPVFAGFFAVRSKSARRIVLAVAILAAGLVQVCCWDAPARVKMSILFAAQFFFAGLLLADLYVSDWSEQPASDWRWDLVSCAGWPVAFLMPDRSGWVFFPFLVLLLYIGAFRGVLFRRLFRNPFLTAVGGMCYTIYLTHYRLIPLILQRADLANRVPLQILVYLVTLGAVSCVFYLLIERPCMNRDWPRRFGNRAQRLVRAA